MAVVDYKKFVVNKLAPTAYYIPNFISDSEEEELLKYIYAAPKPKWTYLSNRRLQDWGGVPHSKGMLVEPLPTWLDKYVKKIWTLDVFPTKNRPNHVLINEYAPGQGIMPHTDGPLFFPVITTINCGSHSILELTKGHLGEPQALLLERRSLLILTDELYTDYLHGIREITSDTVNENIANLDCCYSNFKIGSILERSTRISITIRNVPKVLNIKLSIKR